MSKLFPTATLIGALMASTAVFAQSATDLTKAAGDAATTAATETAQEVGEAVEKAAEKAAEAVATAAEEAAEAAATEAAAETTTDANAAEPAAETADKNEQATDEAADTTEANSETAPSEQTGETAAETAKTNVAPVDPTYIKETYGDWELKCFRTEGSEDPCQMFQLLKEENGNPISEFSVFRIKQGKAVAGATIIVPLGTLLSEELKISIDGGRAKNYPYSFCSMVGCYARVGLTDADINAFKRGAKAKLTIVPAQAPDQKVDINMSLSGFTAAFENASVMGGN